MTGLQKKSTSAFSIPLFIINLKKRNDRKKNILKEFDNRSEFKITVVNPLEHSAATVSLWITIKHIIQNCVSDNEEMIIICEDDHQFTKHYNKELLFNCLSKAKEQNCDILSGGPSCVKSTFQVSSHLYWMEDFTGLQFTVIFKKFFQAIIDFDFFIGNDADIVMSDISDNKFLIFPYISTQKEFGYSDVTNKNNILGRVEELFKISAERVKSLKKVVTFYNNLKINEFDDSIYEDICFSTYVIYDEGNTLRLQHILEQFKGKNEFDITIVDAAGYQTNNHFYAEKIKKIVKTAVANDDDIIIICEDTHVFTADYTKPFLIKNILEAHQQAADILVSGLSDFDSAIPLSENRFWLSSFSEAKFIVIFSKMFPVILKEPFEDLVTTDHVLSEITSHKMALFPFISTIKEPDFSNLPGKCESKMAQRFNRIQIACKKIKFHEEVNT